MLGVVQGHKLACKNCSNPNILTKPQGSGSKPKNSGLSRMGKAGISYTMRLISNW